MGVCAVVLLLSPTVAFADSPVEPGREEARGWAIEELSHREYAAARPGLLARALSWLRDQLGSIRVPHGPGVSIALGLALLVLVVVVALAVQRTGSVHRTGRSRGRVPVFADVRWTAAEHRATAVEYERGGAWGRATVEHFRAIARDLAERAVLTDQPGRTADEVARDAAPWFPHEADALMRAARSFDDVLYGGDPGSPATCRQVRELDERVRSARPARLGVSGGHPSTADAALVAAPVS